MRDRRPVHPAFDKRPSPSRRSAGVKALYLPGTAGNYASTPDSAAVSITGDIDLRAKIAFDSWTAGGAVIFSGQGGAYRYGLGVTAATGVLTLQWSEDGIVLITKSSTVAPTVGAGASLWIRATLDVDNGAVGNDVKFYTSSDGVAWNQLGTTVTTAGVTSIADNTQTVAVGATSAGDTVWAGRAYYAELRNGIDGTVVAKFDPDDFTVGGLSATSDTGEVWTINQSGAAPATIAVFDE